MSTIEMRSEAERAQFTPGPWPKPEYDNCGIGGFSEWWGIQGIAKVYKEADARLIAAAPDMVRLLCAMLDAPDDQPIRAWRGAIKTAIAIVDGSNVD